MKVRQLAVFIENKPGRVSEVAELLGRAGVNIRGFSVSDTADYGIMRLVVDEPDRARDAARRTPASPCARTTSSASSCPTSPARSAGVLKIVSDAGVNIEYVYSLVGTYVVLNVSDADRALQLLEGKPVQLVSQEDIADVRYERSDEGRGGCGMEERSRHFAGGLADGPEG